METLEDKFIKELIKWVKNNKENISDLAIDLAVIARNEFSVNEITNSKCDVCGCTPSTIIRTQFGTFCYQHAKYVIH